MKYNLLKDSVVYGGADAISKLLAFVAFPIIAAALSPDAFGTMELLLTSTALLAMLMNCGLNNALQRFYWDADTLVDQRPVVVSSGFVTLFVFGCLAMLLGLAMLPLAEKYIEAHHLPMSWAAVVAGLVLMAATQYLTYCLDVTRLHFAPWKFFSLSLLSRTLGLALAVLVVLQLNWGVDGIMEVQALAVCLALPLGLWLIRKDLVRNISFGWIKELVKFGYPFIFASMAYWLFASMDRWMLASMSSVAEVGMYSVAFRLAAIVMFFSTAFGQAWSPYAITLKTDFPDSYREQYVRIFMLLLAAMGLVGGSLALFSGELVAAIMPEAYLHSALPLAILSIGLVFQATTQVTALGISLEKKTHILARLAWMTAVCNFLLNLLLIPLFGAAGAAWATLLSYMILTSAYLYYTQKLHPLPIQWFHLIGLSVLCVGFLSLSLALLSHQLSWYVVGLKLLLCALYVITVWLFVFHKGAAHG